MALAVAVLLTMQQAVNAAEARVSFRQLLAHRTKLRMGGCVDWFCPACCFSKGPTIAMVDSIECTAVTVGWIAAPCVFCDCHV